eukprot:COSAG05_NODE_2644_length_2810_cov_16.120251_2_plen_148_part_00
MALLRREALAMAQAPENLESTLRDLGYQLGSAKDRGDFVEAEGLNATLTGLKASVAEAREDIVSGKFRQEMGALDAARHGLSTSTEQSMRRMEKEVNMQIEAKVADLERVHQTERAELEQLLQDKVRLEVLSFHTFRSTYLDFVTTV